MNIRREKVSSALGWFRCIYVGCLSLVMSPQLVTLDQCLTLLLWKWKFKCFYIDLLTTSTSMLVMQNCESTCNLPTKNNYGPFFSRFDSMFVVYTLYQNKTVHVLRQMCQSTIKLC